MLQMGQEREQKYKKEVQEYKEITENKIDKAMEDRNAFESKLNFLKDKLEKSLKQNFEVSSLKDTKIKELETELFDLKDALKMKISRKDVHTSDAEDKVKDQERLIENLTAEKRIYLMNLSIK